MWSLIRNDYRLTGFDFKFEVPNSSKQARYYNNFVISWLVVGYFNLKDSFKEFREENTEEELLNKLYVNYSENFIHYIKGNYIIIQIFSNGFKVFSDRFAIIKFFYYVNNNDFIISDSLKEVIKYSRSQVSEQSANIYALTYHFTNGTTLFHNVKHNLPGQIISYNNHAFSLNYYWSPNQLLGIKKTEVKIGDFVKSLSNCISNYIYNLDDKKLSLSLTGGSDTRNLLSLFLRLGLKPHIYTYGNPDSNDCIKAKKITNALNLEHSVYNIEMDLKTFELYAKKIIKLSGGLASIHRAHRLIAVEKEYLFANNMFLGTMGGEFIRGVSEDNYIISSLIYDNWNNTNISDSQLRDYMNLKYLKNSDISLQEVSSILSMEPYLIGDSVSKKLNALSYITAHLHDAQDVNLYRSVMDEVYTPFLDIDYLELLFSSGFSFENKEYQKWFLLKRVSNPVFSANFLNESFKPLLTFKYTGEHIPSEVIFNKYYAALRKALRKKTSRSYPVNFELSDWMLQFVKKHIPECFDHPVLSNVFDLNKMWYDIKHNNHKTVESYWITYTNPIMMKMIIEEFNY